MMRNSVIMADLLTSGEINDKILYWADYWVDIIDKLDDKNKSFGLSLMNPRLLIQSIIDEIEAGRFQYDEVGKCFNWYLDEYINNDTVLKEKAIVELIAIKKELNNGKPYYLLQLCKLTKKIFLDGTYFKGSHHKLIQCLQKTTWEENDVKSINYLSQNLIIELLNKGYSLETLKDIPVNLFDKFQVLDNGGTHTRFPLSKEWKDFLADGDYDENAYSAYVVQQITELTLEDRLEAFSRYYEKKPEDFFVIFQVCGLKGEVDYTIGDVNIYSPRIKRYVKKSLSNREEELFRYDDKSLDAKMVINVAIKVSGVDDPEALKVAAIEKVDQVLDLFRGLFNVKSKLAVYSDRYVIVDQDGMMHSGSTGFSEYDNRWHEWWDYLDLKEYAECFESGEEIAEIFEQANISLKKNTSERLQIDDKLKYALHWYRKAEEIKKYHEDKLIAYWIVIENLLNFTRSTGNILLPSNQKETKIKLAQELIPNIEAGNLIYDIGWNLHHELKNLYSYSFFGGRKLLDVTHDIAEGCYLIHQPGQVMELSIFIEGLSKLEQNLSRKSIFEKIRYTKKFYSDNQFAKRELHKHIEQMKNEIILIYRYRNKIVHNAEFDNYLLPLYVKKIRQHTSSMLFQCLLDYSKGKNNEIDAIIVSRYLKTQNIMAKLETGKNILQIIDED